MDLEEMRRQFNKNLKIVVESKRDDNKSFLSTEEYNNKIAEVKESKILLSTPGSIKSMRNYRLVRRYDVITAEGKDRLIKPLAETSRSKLLFYVTNEEMFDIIHNAHLEIGHGGRNRMTTHINEQYCNITIETIMIYLRLCTDCQKNNSNGTPRKKFVSRPMFHYSHFNSHVHIDFIDMRSQSYENYHFIMAYQDDSTKFILLKPLKTKGTKEVACNLLELFTTFGTPSVLHSSNGHEFVNSVLMKLHEMWPELEINESSSSQNELKEHCPIGENIEEMLKFWLEKNETNDWLSGIKFVQLKKNCSIHLEIGKSPYEALFGRPAKVRLPSTGNQDERLVHVKEEPLDFFLEEIKEEPNEFDDFREDTEHSVLDNQIDTTNIQIKKELAEEVDNENYLQISESERKRHGEFLEKQPEKIIKSSFH